MKMSKELKTGQVWERTKYTGFKSYYLIHHILEDIGQVVYSKVYPPEFKYERYYEIWNIDSFLRQNAQKLIIPESEG